MAQVIIWYFYIHYILVHIYCVVRAGTSLKVRAGTRLKYQFWLERAL